MPDHDERHITVPDGLTLFVRDYPAAGDDEALPLICLHGLTRNSADFAHVAPRLAARGRRVLALDVRGRGRSDWDGDATRYRPDVYVADVLHLLDDLGLARAVFIGTSMGGLMTMLLAQAAPERIAAAVLNDIGPVLNPAGLARILGYVGTTGPYASWAEITDAIRATQAAAFPDADDAFWERFARRVARQNADGTVAFAYDPAIAANFTAAPTGPAPDLAAAFSALAKNPVLAVHGALSDILTAEGVDAMRSAKPDLAVVEVARVGHAPMLDEPEAAAAIDRFLSAVP